MGTWGDLIKSLFVDDMNKPDTRQSMSPRQMYDYLVSLRRRSPEQQQMLEQLHRALGKDKWD